MKERLKNTFWKWKWGIVNAIEDAFNDERGASEMIAVVVLIVIILAAAVIFREQLMAAVNKVFENLTTFIG